MPLSHLVTHAVRHSVWYGFCEELYGGRTFIKPKQSSRMSAVKVKLNVLKEAVAGKRVIGSMTPFVRGTTTIIIVKMLRDAGAKRSSCEGQRAAVLHPCYFRNRYSVGGPD